MISVYHTLLAGFLAFGDINAFNQCVGTRFCLLCVILLDIERSFSEGRYMKEALLRLTFLE